jgi:hypothetical protein
MPRSISAAVLLVVGLVALMACSPDLDGEASNTSRSPGSAESGASSSSPDVAGSQEIPREDLVLCPAIERVAGDLVALGGFEPENATAGVQAGVNECHLRGEGGAFVVVALAPAIFPSVAEYASQFPVGTEPARELGESAVVVPSATQPHVVFELFGHILDVGIENFDDPPDTEVVLEVGQLVRDALVRANGG